MRKELVRIQTIDDRLGRELELRKLARKVGANITGAPAGGFNAGEPELIDNINKALQTATMIDMSKTSVKSCIIAILAAIAAIVSAFAAWAAVFKSAP